jgi:nucleotide-binding universal stress UspA family protein
VHRIAESGAELARSVGLQADALATHDEGQVAAAIVQVARTRRAAAIVVGSRGLTGLRARLEGSTSNAFLKHSPCRSSWSTMIEAQVGTLRDALEAAGLRE